MEQHAWHNVCFTYSGVSLKAPSICKYTNIAITEIHILSIKLSDCYKLCAHCIILLTVFVTLVDMRRLPEANAWCYFQTGPWKIWNITGWKRKQLIIWNNDSDESVSAKSRVCVAKRIMSMHTCLFHLCKVLSVLFVDLIIL